MEKQVEIKDEYITLGQLLKHLGIISTGGAAKWFLKETPVHINGELEDRRGRKLYDGDRVEIRDFGTVYIKKATID